jgi:hypothetical protein
MERMRARAARNGEPVPRHWLQHALALLLALAAVTLVMLAINAFVTAMQRFMDVKIVDPAPAAAEPMPAYSVPEAVSRPQSGDPDPRPSQEPAQGTSPATP